jgi:hypothetical protein
MCRWNDSKLHLGEILMKDSWSLKKLTTEMEFHRLRRHHNVKMEGSWEEIRKISSILAGKFRIGGQKFCFRILSLADPE